MTLVYTCKHCGSEVGRLHPEMIDVDKIGWNVLSMEEKRKLMHYDPNQKITIGTICEGCQSLLEHNPHYHELDFFIQ